MDLELKNQYNKPNFSRLEPLFLKNHGVQKNGRFSKLHNLQNKRE